MSKRKLVRRLVACACVAAGGLAVAAGLDRDASAGSKPKPSAMTFNSQTERVDIRLRSLTTRATGQLTIEASEGGGRARLTALNLPEPQTVAEGATQANTVFLEILDPENGYQLYGAFSFSSDKKRLQEILAQR